MTLSSNLLCNACRPKIIQILQSSSSTCGFIQNRNAYTIMRISINIIVPGYKNVFHIYTK